jgi:endonuclease/exonuclease/phosphatase family protein
MKISRFTVVWCMLGTLAACAEAGDAAGPLASVQLARRDAPPAIVVLTRNMYVGADLDAVIGALASPSSEDDLPALLGAIQTLQITDYPARAGAFAAEIARARPHVVGLQEVSQIDIDLTALGLPITVHQDFLAILADSLDARGLHYAVAARVQNIVAQPLPGIGLIDYDAVLVDADRVSVGAVQARNYSVNIGVVAPGIELKRGYVLVPATIAGVPYFFASTHLESGNAPGVATLRAAQAQELAASLPAGTPVVLMGDLNDTPGSPMHRALQGAGLTDTWAALRPGEAGFTCCEQADLGNVVPQLIQRLDYVWLRGWQSPATSRIDRIGDEPGDRVPGPAHPVWPSDHAGLVLTLPGRGT